MKLDSRPVRKSDFPAICSFAASPMELYYFHPKASYPLTPAALGKTIEARASATVVLWQEAVAGFADLFDCERGVRCRIGNVIVAPAHRGKGVATFLVERMIEIAISVYDARVVELGCFNTNIAGLRLYPKLGFRPFEIESRTGPAGEPLALIQMRLALRNPDKV